MLEHHTYCPDLFPRDFHPILKVKEPLRGRRFRTQDEIAAAVNHEMSKFTQGEAGGIRRLPHRWQRTVDALGGLL